MDNNSELLGAIADLSRSVEEYNGSALTDCQIGLAVAPDVLDNILAAQDLLANQSINKGSHISEEVTRSPCHAVTHGMYSVNSAKIYIQF